MLGRPSAGGCWRAPLRPPAPEALEPLSASRECSCRSLLLDLGFPVGRDLLRRVAGEGEEDLVEAGLAEREVGDRDPLAGELTDRLGGEIGARARCRQRRRVGLEAYPGAEKIRQPP